MAWPRLLRGACLARALYTELGLDDFATPLAPAPLSLEDRLAQVVERATPAWSPRTASLRHLANEYQNSCDALLERFFALWRSTAQLLQYRRDIAQLVDSGFRTEPPQTVTLAHACSELRIWFCVVAALDHVSLRRLRIANSSVLYNTCTAQARPNFLRIAERPALLWHRGCILPTLICIAQPAPGDENHPRALLDFLD